MERTDHGLNSTRHKSVNVNPLPIKKQNKKNLPTILITARVLPGPSPVVIVLFRWRHNGGV